VLLRQKPVLCNYYLTYRCNATCSFCDIWERPSPYVSIETAKKNFADLKKLGVKVIDFTENSTYLYNEIKVEQVGKEIKGEELFDNIYRNTEYINVSES
jgi:MoaA/NifB/PqqE/SkfB family radical SAM enzyme